ncbi:electron transfer flavoprotein-ubiquinone oxidoreductase [Cavenderia fasciculata]|uniref:electron-transferring-flavoprotein dehydrogenase n=1 Tax=Cavenderia fasciculata TaxID=261658 RepID=F4Q8G1_CACFS|nr:electron transfer flavoprotein-ubiquinone oxidoreductase [Cavenderia fasciculata]EGG16061.1 electron transfer flavoprotein-ubiquinone oxidoreductase [Cavenderia fasciculata]|eukprot:XP_004352386.1 electron transfer flavoprotein-ubiquinone oxidoreductase [Cavenderia fasciculata]
MKQNIIQQQQQQQQQQQLFYSGCSINPKKDGWMDGRADPEQMADEIQFNNNNNNTKNIYSNNSSSPLLNSSSSSRCSISSNNNVNNQEEEEIINNNNVQDGNGEEMILEQFSNQVGGHCAILSIHGKICKPMIPREHQFYRRMSTSGSRLLSFIPSFHGIAHILKTEQPPLPQQQQQQIDQQQSNNTTINSIYVNSPSSQLFRTFSKQKKKTTKHPINTTQQYILLEDLTKKYSRPSIIDIKMGTRQKGAICQSTTSTTLGIRICGIRIYCSDINANIIYDRFYGRTLNQETLASTLSHFFYGSNNYRVEETTDIINCIIEKLENIKEIILCKDFPFKLYSSSLLLIYEGLNQNNNNNKLFNNSLYSEDISSSSSSSSSDSISISSEVDSSCDIDSNVSTLSDLESDDDDDDEARVERGEGRRDSSAGDDVELSAAHQNNQKFTTTTTKTTTTTTTTLTAENDVKLIDFAHAIEENEENQDSLEDDGYIFGITNLINILVNIIKDKTMEQQQQQSSLTRHNDNNHVGGSSTSSSASSSINTSPSSSTHSLHNYNININNNGNHNQKRMDSQQHNGFDSSHDHSSSSTNTTPSTSPNTSGNMLSLTTPSSSSHAVEIQGRRRKMLRFQRVLNNNNISKTVLNSFIKPSTTTVYYNNNRGFSTSSSNEDLGPRDSDQFDVVIVGAGPSGLSAAIRIKQLCQEQGKDLRVCVVEKGAEVGSHILSGAVLQPTALDELIPDWKEKGAPLNTPVKEDAFYFLTESNKIRLPTPRLLHNEGNYIVSMGNVVRWLGQQAEEMGVEIYPGFAASEVLYKEDGSVDGIATSDVGIGKDGKPTSHFTRGMELRAPLTLFAEGCRGSLTKTLFSKFDLRDDCDVQTFGLGIKELWQVKPEVFQAGKVVHTLGHPLSTDTYGGSFMYHMEDNLVSIGLVVGLDYENPYLNPYQEFQRMKQHPVFRSVLEGGQCIQYGARTINEGGLQSIPKLIFPGGALIGCTAGFVNVPKIKGNHNAMKTGMLAAEAAFESLIKQKEEEESNKAIVLENYPEKLKKSWVWSDLKEVKNIRPSFHWGFLPGLIYSALEMYIFRGNAPWTLSHGKPDHQRTKPASESTKITYPKPDGLVTFDLMTSVSRSGTNHEENQPAHLKVRDYKVAERVNRDIYDGPEGRFCPAGVYEWVEKDGQKDKQLQINAQNCVHCKTCDIKDPTQNIDFTVPEGTGGPQYGSM